jgi:hypothetical protein
MHASTEAPQLLHGIDMSAPDAPEQLLDFHRLTFGDALMRVNPDADEEQDDDADNSDADDQQDDDADNDSDDEDTDAKDLGDKGKRALDSMKAKVKAANAAKKAAEAEAARLKAEKANAGKPAEEQALDAARAEGATAATAAANKRIIRSEVKAAAAGKLKNPALAVKLIDLDSLEVDEDGEVDEEAIAEAISALLEENPYLAAQGGDTKFDSARGKPKQKPKLTKADLDKMTPEQVAKAYDEGRVQA